VGGRATGHSLAPLLDPHPRPLPQGGGQEFDAPLLRKLAQMRAAPDPYRPRPTRGSELGAARMRDHQMIPTNRRRNLRQP